MLISPTERRCDSKFPAVRAVLPHNGRKTISYVADSDIQHEGDLPKSVFAIVSGWAYSYMMLADGQRQILYLHKAGDVAGLCNLGLAHAICSVRTVGACSLREMPIPSLMASTSFSPEVAAYFLQKSTEMQTHLMRSLVAVGRMGAKHRIVWMLLMLQDRLSSFDFPTPKFEVPFNQSELGDFIGLTNVSVSKILCELSSEGFIARNGNSISILRQFEMEEMVNYHKVKITRNDQIPQIPFQ